MAILTVKCRNGHVSKYDNVKTFRCRDCDKAGERRRYHNDPEYRARKLAQSRATYWRKKQEHLHALSKPIQSD